jgi:PAS domain S-box-containing protein
MKASEIFANYRKDPRFIVTVPILIFVATSLVYYTMLRARELTPQALTNRLLLFILWNINIILILGILFVLTRNVIKLILDRQRGVAGSRFRTKLVLTYLATAIVPIALLFFVATDLLRVSIDRWFNTPVRTLLSNSERIAEQAETLSLRQAERAAAEIGSSAGELDARGVERLLEHVRAHQGVDVAAIYEDGAVLRMLASTNAPLHEIREPPATFFADLASTGSAFKIELTSQGKWIRAGVPVENTRGRDLAAVAGVFLSDSYSRMLDENVVANRTFQQLDSQRQALKASQTSLFLTITLYILFGTLWVSIYVSRRITGPVQALAEGTRTLAAGDYSHRIEVRSTDEIGMLIDSFNAMAGQLEQQREALTQSNRQMAQVNRELDEERAYLSTILESVSTGIVAFSEDLELLSMNQAALRILGLRQAPEPRTRLEDLFSGDLAQLSSALSDLQTRGTKPREVSIFRDGEARYLELSAARMTSDDETIGWVLAMEDSTPLVQAQKLAAWGEAARRIAHEINNPLTPIQLSAERIRRKFLRGDEDVRQVVDEACQTIVSEVGQLKKLVSEFSRFARMPAVNLRMSDVGTIVREVAQLYTEVKPSVDVQVDPSGDLSAVVDPEHIRRALINLMDNAIEATDEGAVRLAARRTGSSLVLEVSDTGCGVAADQKDKLFLPYYSTKEKGTGLGLAIVQRIVKDHDGRISVHDNVPRGTRFEIEIPAA